MSRRDDPRIRRFVEAARQFRAIIERPELRGGELVRAALPVLSELYAAGLGLEGIQLGDGPDRDLKAYEMSHEQWWAMFQELWDRIGADACYWMMYDPTKADQADEKPVAGNLGDDLADIYRDVVTALRAWDSGDDDLLDENRLGVEVRVQEPLGRSRARRTQGAPSARNGSRLGWTPSRRRARV